MIKITNKDIEFLSKLKWYIGFRNKITFLNVDEFLNEFSEYQDCIMFLIVYYKLKNMVKNYNSVGLVW